MYSHGLTRRDIVIGYYGQPRTIRENRVLAGLGVIRNSRSLNGALTVWLGKSRFSREGQRLGGKVMV